MLGTIQALYRYPLKSALPESRFTLQLETDGEQIGKIIGDRRWAIREVTTGLIITGKQTGYHPLLHVHVQSQTGNEDGLRLIISINGRSCTVDPHDRWEANRLLSKLMEAEVELVEDSELGKEPIRTVRAQLVMDPGTLRDAQPVHIISSGTITSLAQSLGRAVNHHRFRPNIFVQVAEDYPVELNWIGHEVRIGAAILAIRKSTKRCQMIRLQQGSLPLDPDIKGLVKRQYDDQAGVYARVIKSGTISSNDNLSYVQ